MALAEEIVPPKSDIWKRARPFLKPKILVGGSIVAVLFFMGLFAPLISPFQPNVQDLSIALTAPQWLSGPHMLGTEATAVQSRRY